MEEWRNVVGYEGLYMVSNYGRVKSLNYLNTGKEKIMQLKGQTYRRVILSKNGVTKTFLVHKLVAVAFPEICGEWFEGAEINHKDENPANNCAWNLEWCTHLYNCKYGTRNIRTGNKTRNHPVTSKSISQYTMDGEFVKKWHSTRDVERITGWRHTNIARCARGVQPYAYGYLWRYE